MGEKERWGHIKAEIGKDVDKIRALSNVFSTIAGASASVEDEDLWGLSGIIADIADSLMGTVEQIDEYAKWNDHERADNPN